jgi:hypothetical protein
MQMATEQATQQAQMSQMQADQATQQATMQAQQDAQEKEMLSQESLAKGESLMQLRQAMQSYRENLQQLALQDPTAAAGPSPMEQGMPTSPEEAAMAEQAAAQGGAPPEAGMPPEAAGMPPEGVPPEMVGGPEAAAPAPPKKAPKNEKEKKEEKEGGGVTVNVEKKSSAIPELLKESSDFSTRMIGAAIGAAGGAGLQALSDRPGKGGMSMKERVLKAKLQHYQHKKKPTVFDKHMMNITRAMADTAKINREHPGSAAAMAAIGGAVAGATLAPTVGKMFGRR